MPLDLVFLKSSVSLVNPHTKYKPIEILTSKKIYSWIRDEGIFRWLDISHEKCRLGKTLPPPEYYSTLCIVVPELYIIPRRWQLLRTFQLVKRGPQYTWRVASATLFHDALKSFEPVKPR